MTGRVLSCCLFLFLFFHHSLIILQLLSSEGQLPWLYFKNKVHIGYIAAMVAASNAGGSGSVVGDTTTTMMWIDGVAAFNVLHAYVAAVVAFLFFAWFAAHQQDKYQKIQKDADITC